MTGAVMRDILAETRAAMAGDVGAMTDVELMAEHKRLKIAAMNATAGAPPDPRLALVQAEGRARVERYRELGVLPYRDGQGRPIARPEAEGVVG